MIKSKTLLSVFMVVSVFLSVVACNQQTATETLVEPSPSTTDVQPDKGATPVVSFEESSPVSPIATPETLPQAEKNIFEPPTPNAGLGVVYGTIAEPVAETQHIWTLNGNSIYLSQLVYIQNDSGEDILPMLRVDLENDLQVDLETGSTFVFTDVLPAEYGVILTTPLEQYPVPGDHSSGFLVVEVKPDQSIELGQILLP